MNFDFTYPKVKHMGDRDLAEMEGAPYLIVQEKIDGSQMNWCWDEDGKLHVRSKGAWQLGGPENRVMPDALFLKAINHLAEVGETVPGLRDVWFSGEAVTSPKHNRIAYERTPKGFIVLFDAYGYAASLVPQFAKDMGLEPVRRLMDLIAPSLWREHGPVLLEEITPMLGGKLAEGVVLKHPHRPDLVGKLVRPEFREIDNSKYKTTGKDAVAEITEALNTEARFEKAVQHLRDDGLLKGSPQDIGPLMKEVARDILDEATEEIKNMLWDRFGKDIRRNLGRGLPEWYKERLQQ